MLISTDFGESWTELPGLRSVWNYAWGAPLPGSNNHTLYAQGKNVSNPLNSYPGIYCSLDNGHSWGKLVDFPLSITSVAQAMAADMSTFGRVSVGFTGNGFAYGQLNPNAPDIPSTFCTSAWDSGLTFEGPTTTSFFTLEPSARYSSLFLLRLCLCLVFDLNVCETVWERLLDMKGTREEIMTPLYLRES